MLIRYNLNKLDSVSSERPSKLRIKNSMKLYKLSKIPTSRKYSKRRVNLKPSLKKNSRSVKYYNRLSIKKRNSMSSFNKNSKLKLNLR